MRLLPSFTLVGFELLSFFRGKKGESKNLFGGVSLLQTLRSFVVGIGDQKQYTEEEELIEAGRLLATHLGEKEIVSAASEILPQNIAQEIVRSPFIPSGAQESAEVSVSEVLEIPKTIYDIFSSK
jgi:hypothetical protein